MKLRRFLAALTAASLTAIALAGCAQTPAPNGNSAQTPPEATSNSATTQPAEKPTEAPKAEKVTITTASMFGGTDPHAKPYQEINAQFMTDNPGVTIEDSSRMIDEAWRASIINDFNAGNAPDVLYYVHHADGQAIVDTGEIVDVETIQAEFPEYAANIDPGAMDILRTRDGKPYCVPMKGYWMGVFCNKALFDQYGLALPGTWAEMETAIKTFSENGIVPFALALGHIPHFIIEHAFLTYGGVEALRARPKTAEEIPESWVKGVELLQTLTDMKAFPADTNSTTEDVVNLMFNEGKAAMLVSGSWFPGQVALSDDTGKLVTQDQVALIPFPVHEGATGTPGIVAGWSGGFYISKAAWEDPAKRELCVKLVMAHTSRDGIAKYCGPELGGVPADPAVIPEGTGPLVAAGNEYWQKNRANTADPACDHMNADPKNVLYQGLPKVATGAMTAEELLKTVIEKGAYR